MQSLANILTQGALALSPAFIIVGDWKAYLPPLVAALKPVLGAT